MRNLEHTARKGSALFNVRGFYDRIVHVLVLTDVMSSFFVFLYSSICVCILLGLRVHLYSVNILAERTPTAMARENRQYVLNK